VVACPKEVKKTWVTVLYNLGQGEGGKKGGGEKKKNFSKDIVSWEAAKSASRMGGNRLDTKGRFFQLA